MSSYIPDPSREDRPLSAHDVEAHLSAVAVLFPKHVKEVTHLLNRVAATVAESNRRWQQSQVEFEKIRNKTRTQGRSSSLDPIEATRFLSSEQLVKILSERGEEVSAATEKELEKANELVRDLNSKMGQVRAIALALAEDPNTPAEFKVKLQRAISATEAHEPQDAVAEAPAGENDTDGSESKAQPAGEESPEPETSSWTEKLAQQQSQNLGNLFS